MERLSNHLLSPDAIHVVAGSSKGTQGKYYDNGYWYKVNTIGCEGLAEYLSTLVLSCSNIEDFVTYEQCAINGKSGCRSVNFLRAGETYVSIQRLYDLYIGGQLTNYVYTLDNVEDRIQYVVGFVHDITGLELHSYLAKMLSFDALVLNTDRHFHNIGVIYNTNTNSYRTAPVFDNGSSLLSNFTEFPFDCSIDENIERAIGKPFSANLEYQAHCFSYGLKLDYAALEKLLSVENQSRSLEVLHRQLTRYEGRFRIPYRTGEPNKISAF